MNSRKPDHSEKQHQGRRAARSSCLFLMIICLCVPTLGQMKDNKKLSRLHLSNNLRAQLRERFNLFVEYEKTRHYEKQFDLLAKDHLRDLLHMDTTKENYIKFKQENERAVGKLIGIKVKNIKRAGGSYESLDFSTVATLRKDGSTYVDEPIFVAYLLEGSWYFSLLYIN